MFVVLACDHIDDIMEYQYFVVRIQYRWIEAGAEPTRLGQQPITNKGNARGRGSRKEAGTAVKMRAGFEAGQASNKPVRPIGEA